jgi:MYXO-CTERM domain-containing protein
MRGVDGAVVVTQSVGVTTASDSGCQVAGAKSSPAWLGLATLILVAVRLRR